MREIPPSDIIMQLRALVLMRDNRLLTEQEYMVKFEELNRQHGEQCSCENGIAVYIHTDGSHLCGACAKKVLG